VFYFLKRKVTIVKFISKRIATASFGLQGVQSKDVEKVEQVIHDTLKKAYQDGFEASRVENIIHQIELGLKHVCLFSK
jgi:Zn-dependent M16 (insulinase) family peptidase